MGFAALTQRNLAVFPPGCSLNSLTTSITNASTTMAQASMSQMASALTGRPRRRADAWMEIAFMTQGESRKFRATHATFPSHILKWLCTASPEARRVHDTSAARTSLEFKLQLANPGG